MIQEEMFPPQPKEERSQYQYLRRFITNYKKLNDQQKRDLLKGCNKLLHKAMTDLSITVFTADNMLLSLFKDDVVVVEKGKGNVKN